MIKKVIIEGTIVKDCFAPEEITIDGEDSPNFRFTDEREVEVESPIDFVDLANWMVDAMRDDKIEVKLKYW